MEEQGEKRAYVLVLYRPEYMYIVVIIFLVMSNYRVQYLQRLGGSFLLLVRLAHPVHPETAETLEVA